MQNDFFGRAWLGFIAASLGIFLTACIAGGPGECPERYNGILDDAQNDLEVTVESTGYDGAWNVAPRILSLDFEPGKSTMFNLLVSNPSCSSAIIELRFTVPEEGQGTVSEFTYMPRNCSDHVSEPEVTVLQNSIECSGTYEWDGQVLTCHLNSCVVTNTSPDATGLPVVTSVTITGSVTSRMSRLMCL